MGRTVPSFRIVLAQEKKEWKPFRDTLDKKDRKEFDELWDIARNYVSACSNSVQLVPLQPIILSILFQHYKQLKECSKQIEEITTAKGKNVGNVSSSSEHQIRDGGIVVMMTEQEEKPLETYADMVEEMEQEIITSTTLDGFI